MSMWWVSLADVSADPWEEPWLISSDGDCESMTLQSMFSWT